MITIFGLLCYLSILLIFRYDAWKILYDLYSIGMDSHSKPPTDLLSKNMAKFSRLHRLGWDSCILACHLSYSFLSP